MSPWKRVGRRRAHRLHRPGLGPVAVGVSIHPNMWVLGAQGRPSPTRLPVSPDLGVARAC